MTKETNELSITLASVPDREDVVAELWQDDMQWAELSCRHDSLVLEIYPNPRGAPWTFRFEDVVAALAQAKQRIAPVRDQ